MKIELRNGLVVNHRGVVISGNLSKADNYTLTLVNLFKMVKVTEEQAAKLAAMVKYIINIAKDVEQHKVVEIKRARKWWRAIKASVDFMINKPYIRSVNDPYMRYELKQRIERFILTPTYSELVELKEFY